MPPRVSSSSGSRVPCIGTSVSGRSPSGTGAPFGRAATQHGSPAHVPSQWRGPRPSTPRGGASGVAPAGSRKPSPSGTTRSFWSWTISQRPVPPGGPPPPRLAGVNSPRRQSMLKGR